MTVDELTKQAIEKGYKVGVIVDSLGGTKNYRIKEDSSKWYMPMNNFLRTSDDCVLYKDGRWATIKSDESILIYNIY